MGSLSSALNNTEWETPRPCPSTEAAQGDTQLDMPHAPSPSLGPHVRHGAGPWKFLDAGQLILLVAIPP